MTFGTGETIVNSKILKFTECEICHEKGMIKMVILARYLSLVWIPIIPIGKKPISQCRNCKHTSEYVNMRNELSKKAYELKSKSKTPFYHFIGLGLIMIIFVFAKSDHKENLKKDFQLLASPKVGDKYEIRNGYKDYTIYNILEVQRDSIVFELNKYSVSSKYEIKNIDRRRNFLGEKITLSKNEVILKYKNKSIIHLNR